ncbi:acyltransferase [Paraburkholderia nemoris]|uniref:acyltransferase family protein n=1 Tax=Paraburkholderia nemoris TaxID=2793076 RepID=UPI0038BDA124
MKKLDSLTALRFFAAVSIVIEHSKSAFRSMDWIPHFHYDFGVSFFFVLSGFILCYTYRDFDSVGSVRRFYVARIARVWPLHLFMLGTFLVVIPIQGWFFGGTDGHRAAIFLANIFLIHAWIPIIAFFFSFNAVSWSISTEAFFYLMFPVLRHRWESTWHWKSLIVALVVFGVLAVASVYRVSLINPQTPLAVSAEGIGYISPFIRIIEFLLGMLTARAFDAIRKWVLPRGTAVWTVLEVCAIGLIVFIERLAGYTASSPWAIFGVECTDAPAFPLLILVFALGNGLISKLISARPLVILGEASFALYLSHQLLLRVFDSYRGSLGASDFALCTGYWIAAIAISLLLWALVEQPARKHMRRLGSKSKPVSVGNI